MPVTILFFLKSHTDLRKNKESTTLGRSIELKRLQLVIAERVFQT